jgi:hypothetical protein
MMPATGTARIWIGRISKTIYLFHKMKPKPITQEAILEHLAKRPYISADTLCVHLGIPIKTIAKARSGAAKIPGKYLGALGRELGLTK